MKFIEGLSFVFALNITDIETVLSKTYYWEIR